MKFILFNYGRKFSSIKITLDININGDDLKKIVADSENDNKENLSKI
jgi:hypothetical protein